MGFLGLFVLDGSKDCLAIDILAALADDSVANLTDQDNKAGRGVIVG